jgi:hypothetical protein
MVGDDDGVDFPSPKSKTDSRSAIPRKNRRWRRLRIMKRDELFSLIFSSATTIIWRWNQGKWAHQEGNTPQTVPGGGAAWWVLSHQEPPSGGSWL